MGNWQFLTVFYVINPGLQGGEQSQNDCLLCLVHKGAVKLYGVAEMHSEQHRRTFDLVVPCRATMATSSSKVNPVSKSLRDLLATKICKLVNEWLSWTFGFKPNDLYVVYAQNPQA